MARLQKRADGRYRRSVTYSDPETGKTKRHYVYGQTQKEVNDAYREASDRLAAGSPVRDDSRTLAQWLAEWRKTGLKVSDRSHSTKALYTLMTVKHVEPCIGHVPLGKLRPADVQRLLLTMTENGLSASTQRNAYAALRTALDEAVSNGLLAVNPVARVKRPKLTHSDDVKALNAEQARKLLTAATKNQRNRPDEEPRYGRAIRLLLLTGLRRGELLALRWDDVDLDRAEATVRGSLVRQEGQLVVSAPKTAGSRRTIALSPSAVAALKAQRVAQAADKLKASNVWAESGYIFTTETGSPVDPRNLLRVVTKAAKAADLPDWVTVHTLRHTYATQALLNGVPIHVVSRSLGHSTIAITADTYGHLTDDAASSAAATVADALGL